MPSLTPKIIDGHTYYYARYCQRADGKPGCGNWGLRDALWVSLAQAGALGLCPNYLS